MRIVNEVTDCLEKLSPKEYACDWDNVGLHVGRKESPVNKILVTLDIDNAAVEMALEKHCDMIVSHHPLMFKGIKQLNEDTLVSERALTLAENHISAYCMHTNFDTIGGMGELAARTLGLVECEVLEEVKDGYGIGQIGKFDFNMPLCIRELCELVKERFGLEHVILFGDETADVSKVAIIPGSGKDDIALAAAKGATTVITGDVSYHFGLDAACEKINVIDAGHYGIEHIFIDFIADYLADNFSDLEIVKMPICNPQKYI